MNGEIRDPVQRLLCWLKKCRESIESNSLAIQNWIIRRFLLMNSLYFFVIKSALRVKRADKWVLRDKEGGYWSPSITWVQGGKGGSIGASLSQQRPATHGADEKWFSRPHLNITGSRMEYIILDSNSWCKWRNKYLLIPTWINWYIWLFGWLGVIISREVEALPNGPLGKIFSDCMCHRTRFLRFDEVWVHIRIQIWERRGEDNLFHIVV